VNGWSRLAEKDRRALTFGAAGVVAILGIVFVGFPAMSYWDGLTERVATARRKLQAIESGVMDAAEASQRLQELRKEATVLREPREINQQTARMLQQVEGLPAYGEITVARLEALPLRQEQNYTRSAVSIQFSGTLPDLGRLLHAMEGAEPRLKVERLDLTAHLKDTSRVEGLMVVSACAVVLGKDKKDEPG
jgi:hypothetical protein